MKRPLLPWLLAALLAGCAPNDQLAPAAGLTGTYDLAHVGSLLFVSSAGRNELRVLELDPNFARRGFVRAPNPLEPLSIPVVERPQQLARDVSFEDVTEGRVVDLHYVYVRSAGSQEISVVGADRSLLRELKRLPTPGPVTAMAGRAPASRATDEPKGPSTLYYAVQKETGSEVWKVTLPPPEGLGSTPVESLGLEPVVQAPGEAVVALLVLPQEQLVVATRSLAGRSGRTFRLDEQTRVSTALRFGGPVRLLATHDKVEGDKERSEDDIAAGARVFAVLDEAACSAAPECTGVQAVDASSGQLALDSTGHPMLTLGQGSGLPTGLSVRADTKAQILEGSNRTAKSYPLLGVLPLSSGRVLLFDGVGMRLFDTDIGALEEGAAPGTDNAPATAEVVRIDAAGNAQENTQLEVQVSNGVTPDAVYYVAYQNIFPGLGDLPRDPASPTRFEIPGGMSALVRPQDVLILLPESQGAACSVDLLVDAVEAPTQPGAPGVLRTTTPVPPECAAMTRFQVRAAGAQPFLILENGVTVRGRIDRGETFEVKGPYIFHPTGYGGAPEGVVASFRLSGYERNLTRGDAYQVVLRSRFVPYGFQPSLAISFARYRVPGRVVQVRVGETDYAYIAYPTADGILQANLEAALDVQRGFTPFE